MILIADSEISTSDEQAPSKTGWRWSTVIIASVLGALIGYSFTTWTPWQSKADVSKKFSVEERREYGLYFSFGAGDSFPISENIIFDGKVDSFSNHVGSNGALFLFLDTSCDKCLELLGFWEDHVKQHLSSGITVSVCLDSASFPLPEIYERFTRDMDILLIDARLFEKKYLLPLYPSIVLTDQEGIIEHIQFGFGYDLEPELWDIIKPLEM